MSGTIRTIDELINMFADNSKGLISAQDIRDLTVTSLGQKISQISANDTGSNNRSAIGVGDSDFPIFAGVTAALIDKGGQFFDVKAYGAKGDGTDDTVAFQSAADAAGDTGIVLVPRSSSFYRLTASINLSGSIMGAGMPEIRMDPGNGDGSMCIFVVNSYSGSGLTISGLHLNGQWSGGTVGESDHAIKLGNTSNVMITGNKIENTYGDCVFVGPVVSGINLVTTGHCDRVRIEHNHLINPRRCCVAIVSGTKIDVNSNQMEKSSSYVAAIDVEPDNAGFTVDDISISFNTYSGADKWVNITKRPTITFWNQRIRIQGNRSNTPLTHYALSAVRGLQFLGNIMTGASASGGSSQQSLAITLPDYRGGIVISGNLDQTTGGSTPNVGWSLIGLRGAVITNNIFAPPSGTTKTLAMQLAKCLDSVIAENSFIECYSSTGVLSIDGTAFGTVDGTYGGKNLIISNNNFTNAYTAIKITGAPVINCVIAGNRIDTANVAILADTTGSVGLIIPQTNIISGVGSPFSGVGPISGILVGTSSGGLKAGVAGVDYPGLGSSVSCVHSGAYISAFGTSKTTGALVLNQAYAGQVFVSSSTVFDQIGIEVTTGGSSAVIRLAIYNDDGTGYPGTLVLDAGTVDATTTGVKTLTISQTLATGRYWLIAIGQVATSTVRFLGGHNPGVGASTSGALSGNQCAYVWASQSGVAATPWTSTIGTTTGCPLVFIHAQ